MASAILVATLVGSTALAHERCETILAEQVAQSITDGCTSPVGLCTQGFVHGLFLFGSTSFVIASAASSAGLPATVEPATTLSYQGALTVNTLRGDVTLSDVGVFDTALGVFTEFSRVVSGTGAFAHATGTLYFSGTFDATKGTFHSTVTGQICH